MLTQGRVGTAQQLSAQHGSPLAGRLFGKTSRVGSGAVFLSR
ncbi:hypothetical protein C4K05_3418 [Pseudomonas chlororaphis subsp. aureofaciens]|nr:hypothetical protein C4K05_3418 [Pseudomonas chlororaphis subsp. aureofaciens]